MKVAALEVIALDIPLPAAVKTPMTSISNVVTLLVRLTDADGVDGWGEIWCNFPRFGLYHRSRILRELVAPMVSGRTFDSPAECFSFLTRSTRVLRLQAGEPGPVGSVIAGIDIALWDIVAKKAGQPLWRLLGGARDAVQTYVSVGWGPTALEKVRMHHERGVTSFKVRSSGDLAAHLAMVNAARREIGPECELMLDLNSSWDEAAALEGIPALAEAGLAWLEEPIPVDSPADTWSTLAAAAPMPLAGGENMISEGDLVDAVELGALGVIQPDMTKWGGFTGTLPIARRVVEAGRRFCPHMFGGGVGTLAAAHLLAASNAHRGVLEWGVNPNPPRDAMLGSQPTQGVFHLGNTPGLGVVVHEEVLARYRVDI
ncbi:MAG: mandelate racemase/muconate lactonizing enzyme family protein [Casimicrobiaceae bacterium]